MILNSGFEIVDIADESIAIPVGDKAKSFKGVVALSETAAFLLKQMKEEKTREQLIDYLTSNYTVERETAEKDFDNWVASLSEIGLIDN